MCLARRKDHGDWSFSYLMPSFFHPQAKEGECSPQTLGWTFESGQVQALSHGTVSHDLRLRRPHLYIQGRSSSFSFLSSKSTLCLFVLTRLSGPKLGPVNLGGLWGLPLRSCHMNRLFGLRDKIKVFSPM